MQGNSSLASRLIGIVRLVIYLRQEQHYCRWQEKAFEFQPLQFLIPQDSSGQGFRGNCRTETLVRIQVRRNIVEKQDGRRLEGVPPAKVFRILLILLEKEAEKRLAEVANNDINSDKTPFPVPG